MFNGIASVFRSINSKLISVDSKMLEKALKVNYLISLVFFKLFGTTKNVLNVVIHNFDSTISMTIDRSRRMGAVIFWTGIHEFREFQFLHKFLSKDMIFVDAGANQGEFTLFAAKRLTQGRVLAFEPLPSIAGVLKANVDLNHFSNVQIFDCGLSNENAVLSIYDFGNDNEGLATFYPGDKKATAQIKVPLKSLDDIVDEKSIGKIDFIKMDIEGGELNALRGSRRIIAKFKPVIMIEINKESYKAAGYSTKDVQDFFDSVGYRAFRLAKGGSLQACTEYPSFGNLILKPID